MIVIGAIGAVGIALLPRPYVAVSTHAQTCANEPTKLASLFSDDQNTMIRLSNPDLSDLRILRTEPANVMPGMFDALLGLSGDGSRLAYVTASNELLDDAHIEAIDVANPATRTELAAVTKGLWVVRPAWSPDNKRLAFVKLDTTTSTPGSEHFELWVADTASNPVSAAKQSDLVQDNFTGGNSASICWTADNRVVLIPSVPNILPAQPSPSAQPTITTPSPSIYSSCGVPIISQNDPAWRNVIMKADADSIGGYGCALTSAAMMLNYFGAALTPDQLSACLGSGADPISWSSVPSCTKGLVSGGVETDFSWSALDTILGSGRPAIVGVLHGLTGSHFVVVTSGGGGLAQNYHITDPWDATTYKTLGSYEAAGYNEKWIVSYSGAGRNCGRLIQGASPVVTTVQDGGATKNPVTVSISPNLKYLKSSSIIKMSDGTIPKDAINKLIPFQSLGKGLTIGDEGIYQLIIVTQAPSQPPVITFFKFTIDKTAPAVDLSLLNLLSAGSEAGTGQLTAAGVPPAVTAPLPSAYPVIDRPGKLKLTYSDTLSGVTSVEYSLDGAAFATYTNDTSFGRTIVVPQPGDHSIAFRGTDLAGNVSAAVTKFFTVLPPPVPTPTPPPSPPPCTSPLGVVNFVATSQIRVRKVDLSWGLASGCPPVTGSFIGSYISPSSGAQIKWGPIPVSPPAGKYTDTPTRDPGYPGNCPGQADVTYSLTMNDSVGHTTTLTAVAKGAYVCSA